jgi:hypothetical protein
MKNVELRNVGVFIREKVWLEPDLFSYKRNNISQLLIFHSYLPMKMEQTECSEMTEYKIQTPGNYPEESMQHSEQGESLKSRIKLYILSLFLFLLLSCYVGTVRVYLLASYKHFT